MGVRKSRGAKSGAEALASRGMAGLLSLTPKVLMGKGARNDWAKTGTFVEKWARERAGFLNQRWEM